MKKRISILLAGIMLTLLSLSGCGGTKSSDDKLIWYARLNKQAANDEVFAKVDEYVRDKIGIGVDVVVLEDYATKIQVINAGNEDYDIVYTSSTINNYFKNAADGNFMALDELLPEHAPKLWNMLDSDIWDALRVDGKVYGITNQQIMARGPGLFIPKQNIELLGLDVNDYKEFSLDNIEKYLRLVKEKTGSYCIVPDFWTGGGSQMWGIEQVVGSNLPGAIRTNDSAPEIFDQYESPEFEEYVKAREKWVKEGLTAPVHVTDEDFKKYSGYPSDQIIPILGCSRAYQPGAEDNFKKAYGIDIEFITISEPILNSYGIAATMTAVNASSKHPEEAAKFLELLHTDKYLFNLIAYGIEGKHYEKTDDSHIKVTDNSYSQPTWAISNLFNSYLLEGQPDDLWEQTKKINDNAKRSPLLGFVPDTDPVKLEVANCNAALDEYLDVVCEGLMSHDTYTAFISKLKAAGCDKIIGNVNDQMKSWQQSR